ISICFQTSRASAICPSELMPADSAPCVAAPALWNGSPPAVAMVMPAWLPEISTARLLSNLAAIVHRSYAQARALLRGQLLPGHDVGVVFQPGDDDLVVLLHVTAAPSLGDQVDTLGGAAHKDNFARGGSVEEANRRPMTARLPTRILLLGNC